MHTDIFDELDNKRGTMFYKAAFYDRSASMRLEPRYRICSEYNYGEVKTELLYFGNDDEKIFIAGEALVDYSLSEDDFNRESDLRAMYYELLEQSADEYYPGWRELDAHWDINNTKQKTK